MQYHNTLDALTFYQTSAECEGLYRQCFAHARLALEAQMHRATAAGVAADRFYLVTDCDETVLDNSAFNARLLETGRDFHASTWSQWCQARRSRGTPGALEFLHFVDMQSIPIYYITSRMEADREVTAGNLRDLGFPLPDSSADAAKTRLFMDGMPIAGNPTRKLQQFDYLESLFGPPLLKLGDNLSDHEPRRYSGAIRCDQRVASLRQEADALGTKWILFPNPIYGGWRESLRVKVGEAELPVRDEPIPVPYQAAPVRPALTPAEAPKTGLLQAWQPS